MTQREHPTSRDKDSFHYVKNFLYIICDTIMLFLHLCNHTIIYTCTVQVYVVIIILYANIIHEIQLKLMVANFNHCDNPLKPQV